MLYLPERLVMNQPEKDVYDYVESSNTAFAVGYSKNQMASIQTGNRFDGLLDANLTAISWIEDNVGYYNGESLPNRKLDRIIKACTLYIDRGGIIVEGSYKEYSYYAQIVQDPSTTATDARIEKKIRTERNQAFKFKSQGLNLHKEILIDGLLRIDGFEDMPINKTADFFKLIREASAFNRSSEMNFIYAIAHKEKTYLEAAKNIISVAAIPIEIEAGPFVKVLQESLGLIAFLCDIDSYYELSETLYEYRGPVVISDVFLNSYENEEYDIADGSGKVWRGRKKDEVWGSGNGSKHDALEKFKRIQKF